MAKGIYKRGNKYWIRYAGLDGKTVFESTGSERFRDAEELWISAQKTAGMTEKHSTLFPDKPKFIYPKTFALYSMPCSKW